MIFFIWNAFTIKLACKRSGKFGTKKTYNILSIIDILNNDYLDIEEANQISLLIKISRIVFFILT